MIKIIRKIKDILEIKFKCIKPSELAYFSNNERIEGICYEELVPLSFNNLVTIFISLAQLRKDGIYHIEDMNGKGVTYCIILPNKKVYFGHTTDIGERFHTWTKDARSKDSSLCKDLRKFGKAIVVIYKVGTEEESKLCEQQMITSFKENIFFEITKKNIYESSKDEVKSILSEYIYNTNNS